MTTSKMTVSELPQCCPPGSHGAASRGGYIPKGGMEDLEGTPCYIVGQGSRGILVAHDAFGLDSGRTLEICDLLASKLGVIVAAPQFWRDGAAGGRKGARAIEDAFHPTPETSCCQMPSLYAQAAWHLPSFIRDFKKHNWEIVSPAVHDHVLPEMRRRGAAKVAALGFCWGGWLVAHASASKDICCGVTFHPSQVEVCRFTGESFDELCEGIACPQMLLAAGPDQQDVKEGGKEFEALQATSFADECVFRTFDAMKHGWVNRGSLEDVEVARDYNQAMELACNFLTKHFA